MKLGELQQAFQTHVLRGAEHIVSAISTDERFSTAVRLGVYTQAYAARLVEVLGETYPAVQASLGARLFAQQVGEFARQQPSRHRSARAYGEELAGWLGAQLTGPRARGAADLARFEWSLAAAFDAADRVALSADALADVVPAQWPALQFEFSPTLRRLSVSSNCVAWWKFGCAEQPRPGRWRVTCPQQWLIWRQDLAVYYRRESKAETRALDAALGGCSFGQLCERLSGPSAAVALLHAWFSAGLIVGKSLCESPPVAPDR